MTYTTIVVGTDGSETASRAVQEAGRLARVHEARLVIVTAFTAHQPDAMARLAGTPSVAVTSRQATAPRSMQWALTDRAQAESTASHARDLATAAGATKVSVTSDSGSPAQVLLDTADIHAAELIVVGSVGLRGPRRLLGSVAEDVLHHAPCDVLVVETKS